MDEFFVLFLLVVEVNIDLNVCVSFFVKEEVVLVASLEIFESVNAWKCFLILFVDFKLFDMKDENINVLVELFFGVGLNGLIFIKLIVV